MTEPAVEPESPRHRGRSDLLVAIGSFAVYLCPVLSRTDIVSLGRVALDTIAAMWSPGSFEQGNSAMADLGTALAAQGVFGFVLSWMLAQPTRWRIVGFVASLPLIVAGVNYDYLVASGDQRNRVETVGNRGETVTTRMAEVTDDPPRQKAAKFKSLSGKAWRLKCTVEEESLLPLRQQIDREFEASGRAWTRRREDGEIGILSVPGCRHTHLNFSAQDYSGPMFTAADGAALWGGMRNDSRRLFSSSPPSRDRLDFRPIASEATDNVDPSFTVSSDGTYLGWVKHGVSDVAVLRELATGQDKTIVLPFGFTTRLLGIDVGADELIIAQTGDDTNVFFSVDLQGELKGERRTLPLRGYVSARRVGGDGWVAQGQGPQGGSIVAWSLPPGDGKYEANSGGYVFAVHPEGRWIATLISHPETYASSIRVVRTADRAELFDIELDGSGTKGIAFLGSDFFAYNDGDAVVVLRIEED